MVVLREIQIRKFAKQFGGFFIVCLGGIFFVVEGPRR